MFCFLLCTFKTTLSFLEGTIVWRYSSLTLDQLVCQVFNEALQGFSFHLYFTGFLLLLKIGGKGNIRCDLHKCGIARFDLSDVWLSTSHLFSFTISSSVSVSISDPPCLSPICPAPPLSNSAYQGALAGSEHLQTLSKFHAMVWWKVSPLISQSPLKSFPPPVKDGGLAGLLALKSLTQHSALLCMLQLIKKDVDRSRGSSALTVFVCHRSLCLCVHVHGDKAVSGGICGDNCCRDRKACFQLNREESHVYFIPGTAEDLFSFAPSCGASHIGCDTLWPRLASTMSAVITRKNSSNVHWLTCWK